jgi:hypothetical protein
MMASLSLPVADDTASQLSARLLGRLDSTPTYWHDVAARFEGAIDADSCLCSLGKEVADSIRTVHETAEVARQRLESLRATFHRAIDARMDELVAKLSNKQSDKACSLERELERLDHALERTRREYSIVRKAVTGNEVTAAFFAELSTTLDRIDALLVTIPHSPEEPSLIELEFDAGALVGTILSAGILVAPRYAQASDVVLRVFQTSLRSRRPLLVTLDLSDVRDFPSASELNAVTASLARRAHVNVSLVHNSDLHPLAVTFVADAAGRSVTAVVNLPEDTPQNDDVLVNCVTVAGIDVLQGQPLPARLAQSFGMQAPLRLCDTVNKFVCTPVISPDGTLYAPKRASNSVFTCAWDGAQLLPVSLADLGVSSTSAVAFVGDTNTLLLAERSMAVSSKILCVDSATRTIRWSAEAADMCGGIAVLPAAGIVISSGHTNSALFVHSLDDGSLLTSTGAESPFCVATDATTNTAYVNTGKTVTAYHWNGMELLPDAVVDAAGTAQKQRPLAVMPPARGLCTSYLVVGMGGSDSPNIRVLSLPDRRLFHTHELVGMHVVGLAADPSGTALAVCDAASLALHVLLWPLPGMPPLT